MCVLKKNNPTTCVLIDFPGLKNPFVWVLNISSYCLNSLLSQGTFVALAFEALPMCSCQMSSTPLTYLWQALLSLVAQTVFREAFAFYCVIYDIDNELKGACSDY